MIELMISLAIGLILVLGLTVMVSSSRSSYHSSEMQVHMLDDGRYGLHLLGQDLRMAGSFGRINEASNVYGRKEDISPDFGGALGQLAADCEPLWYVNLDRKVEGSNGTNPYGASCIPAATSGYIAGTDVLVVRYANPSPTPDAALQANVVYAQSSLQKSRLFVAGVGAVPTEATDFNHRLEVHAYYVSSFTERLGDGQPALHRISLAPGPVLQDEVVVPGVENFQVQFGLTTCAAPPCSLDLLDDSVNKYVNADSIDWADKDVRNSIVAVKVWLLMRSDTEEQGLDTSATFNLGGQSVKIDSAATGDNYRRLLLSSVVKIRNRTGF